MGSVRRHIAFHWHAILLLLIATVLPIRPASAVSVDWGQTYFNAEHTGENVRETILSPENVSGLQLRWSRPLSGEVDAFVVNDHYVVAQVSDGQNLQLWYLNYATGEDVWHVDLGPDVPAAEGTLATADHLIFSGCGLTDEVSYNYSGICAYRKGKGTKVWQFSNPCNCSPEANVVAGLNFYRDVVVFGYFNGGSEGKDYVLSADALSGNIVGAFQTGGYTSLGTTPVTHGLRKLSFDCGGNVCALFKNGTFAWSSPAGAPIGGIAVDRAHIYATLCNGPSGIVALNGNGAPLWNYGASQCNQTPAAVSSGRVYFTAADRMVHALDANTGAEIWSAAAQAASSPSLANGVLYVAGAPGAPEASAYDSATGSLLWSGAPRSASRYPPPIVIDGMLFVANGACGTLCAFGLPGDARRAPSAAAAKFGKRLQGHRH